MASAPLLVVLTGPSGVGKDSILERLRRSANPSHGFPVNATTRKPRPSELDGVDYFFLNHEQFEHRLERGDFLEHAMVYGQHKGVLREQVRAILGSGRSALLRTDVQGARYIKSIVPEAVTIFICPPSFEELEQRMTSRGGDSEDQVSLRLKNARDELATADEFDYTVVNDDLDHCLEEIQSIIEFETARDDRTPTAI
jgi:guanylate kinase